ncbi:response regulator [Maribacter polysiphoniae]|uniref:histidine kinase n=1 Tax=Maribacter polysiphoniae TaxID=429344 RepID=A0A316DWX4_9FLAO|nr:ATP-binding protein [Maribacter polysiphoniae]MBD1262131.1 response regulator [Maribacter polysiphoniae]PWK21822.1 phospho-acceptor domain-containing protein [Maribacter polysiphoniae]
MNRTEELKLEILQLHDLYWSSYLKGDISVMVDLLSDEYTQIGSAEREVFFNKKEAVQFLYETIDQVAGNFEMRNRNTSIELLNETFIVYELCDAYALVDEKWLFYNKFRATTLLKKKKLGWKFIHQHSSFSDSGTSEGQNISIEKITAENQRLQNAVKQRTNELEQQATVLEQANFDLKNSLKELQSKNLIIEEQKKALLQLDAAKTRFFANVSHELRTPLTLILPPLSTALNSPILDDGNKALISLAKEQANQLLGLVSEILDLTKLESGKMEVREEPTDVYQLMRRLISTFESYAKQKNINLIFEFAENMPHGLMLDKLKVERIFNNLISNALKFTPIDGTITITIKDKIHDWRIEVTDNGKGIHPDDLPHLFDRFYQTNQLESPVEGGTGIGLSLAKELAEVMHGELSVNSTLGKGATFTLTLPKKEVIGYTDDSMAIAPVVTNKISVDKLKISNPLQHDEARNKPTILVVEDNYSLRSYLQFILSEDFDVLTAENGQEALLILEQIPQGQKDTPDLIISDVMMPVMDGFKLLEALKTNENLWMIPVVMLTARAEIEDRLTALRIGVDDYLIKPFEEAELFARIKNLLNNVKKRKNTTLKKQEANTIIASGMHLSNTPILCIPDQEWLAKLEEKVKSNIGNFNLSVDILADELFISRAQFFRRVQSLTGMTPLQYIKEIRYDFARNLLETKNVRSVKAASHAIGIKKVQYFSEKYKKRFGKSPSEYLR